MQSILATHAETLGRHIHCINYTDTNSVGGKSYEDMSLGRTQRMVGCNNPILDKCSPEDIVIVTAWKSGTWVAHLGILKKKSDTCLLWAVHGTGGKMWKFNWEYDPCTPDLPVNAIVSTLIEWGLPSRTAYNLFIGRFCYNNAKTYLPYVARAFREGLFPVRIN